MTAHVCDRRMLRDDVLDLDRVHVLTTGDDHVLDAVDDEDVGVGIHVSAVAGVHPSAPERFSGLV